MYYIYCYTNKINGHQYVGQTNNIKRRKNEHRSNSFNPSSIEYNFLFHKKMREYGEENFTFTILEEDIKTLEEANKKEQFWIKKLGTYVEDKKGGYNLTYGGDNFEHQRIYNKETIEKIRKEIKEGISYAEIHKKYKISIGYISGINTGLYFNDKTESYPLRKFYQNENDINYLKFLLIETTIPMTQIAKMVNKAYSTVKKINAGTLQHDNSLNYPLRKKSSVSSRAEKIKQLLLEGKSNQEIIQQTGVSLSTIKRINSGETHYDDTLKYPLR